jgi:hypothetical protein
MGRVYRVLGRIRLKKRGTAVVLSWVISSFLAFTLAGCGSGAGSLRGADEGENPAVVAAANPFAGSWSGPWIDAEAGEEGILSATITKKGKLSVALFNRTLGTSGSGSGSLSGAGAIKASYRYGTGPKLTLKGLLTRGSNGHLVGQFEALYKGRHAGSGAFDLSPR